MAVPLTVTTSWLHDNLDNGDLVILDVTWYSDKDAEEAYKSCHIAGARYLNVLCAQHTALHPRNLPTASDWQHALRRVGVNSASHVVVYDATDKGGFFLAGRAAWTFKVFGFSQVSVLDGGLNKWMADGYETTANESSWQPGNVTATYNSSVRTSYDDMTDNLAASSSMQVLDSRAADVFARGHYPGAVNIPLAGSLLDTDSGGMKATARLQTVFADAGVDLSRPIATMCNSGMSSCSLLLAAQQCGAKQATLFHGGFTEWKTKNPDNIEKAQE